MVWRLRNVRPQGALTAVGRPRSRAAIALTAVLALATAGLVWFGYRATREWQRSTVEVVDQRANEMLALLVAALQRDMKGAHVSVLVPINHELIRADPPYEVRDACARAFARFPYPESLFVWKDTGAGEGAAYVFNRADRPPSWDAAARTEDPYPVVTVQNPPALRALIQRARLRASTRQNFALLDTEIGGVPYQAIVHLLYRTSDRGSLVGLVGFTVNMEWVRANYFAPIVRQVAGIGGAEAGDMALQIVDETGRLIVGNDVPPVVDALRARRFPLLFFDPDLLSALPMPRPVPSYWTARVAPARDGALQVVGAGTTRTFVFISLAAVAMVVGLLATVRAVRVSAELAAMRSDFVSTVTHELKTPLATIRLVSETLSSGRFSTPETIRDYARLLWEETGRLTRLVDNLLTYARANDVRQTYSFERVAPVDLVEDVLERFHTRLDALGFDLHVDVPVDLPPLYVDRAAMLQVLDNIIDNAIKYSDTTRHLRICGRSNATGVHIEVSDRGAGIPGDDLPRVFEKFYRGRHGKPGGSGLGLTIARRVVRDHRGGIDIRSTPGAGTSVDVKLPAVI
jgi:signal transduction histidine kinase